MIRRILSAIAPLLPFPRVIFDRKGVFPYLSRYYIVGAPMMPDGSHPFDMDGRPKPGIQEPVRPFAIFLHHFHRGDDEPELHNHPWVWSIAIVLSGGYREERRAGAPKGGGAVSVRTRRPGSIHVIRADDYHRVTLLGEESWSLFIAGPRTGHDWNFWNRTTGGILPWREFLTQRQDGTSYAKSGVEEGYFEHGWPVPIGYVDSERRR